MKKVKLMFITLVMSLIVMVSFGQNLFKPIVIVNEFGDSIDTRQGNISYGRFSNTATTNSDLKVLTYFQEQPHFNTVEEYVNYMESKIDIQTTPQKEREFIIKQINNKKSLQINNEIKGSIYFKLYEYPETKNIPATFNNTSYGRISVKTSKGIIQTATLINAYHHGEIQLLAYYGETKFVKKLIKYGAYDYNITKIYNMILEETEYIEVSITMDNSSYVFKIQK